MTASETAKICKALGDENRIRIIQLLTRGELCACHILEEFSITQPTLSHHMKILSDSELITVRKQGKWMYYSVNCDTFQKFRECIDDLTAGEASGGSCCCCGKGE